MDGVEMIAKERQEQIEKHGFDAKHDDQHGTELIEAAHSVIDGHEEYHQFPWDVGWWDRIMDHTPQERLAIAGALIAAEIDRLNRADAMLAARETPDA